MIGKEAFLERVRNDLFLQLEQDEPRRKYAFRWFILFWALVCSIPVSVITALYIATVFLPGTFHFFLFFEWLIYSYFLIDIEKKWGPFFKQQKEKYIKSFFTIMNHLSPPKETIQGDLITDACLIDLIRNSCLFPWVSEITKDACFSASLRNTSVSVREAKLTSSYRHNTKSKYVSVGLVFTGILIDVIMPKPSAGCTLLLNTKLPDKIPLLKRIYLESNQFNQSFQIFTTNQIQARALLTPRFMEQLMALKKYFKANRIDVSFWGNHALFALHTSKDLFEPYSMRHSGLSIKTYEKFYDEIKMIDDMIRILQINNKKIRTNSKINPDKNPLRSKFYQSEGAYGFVSSVIIPLLCTVMRTAVVIFCCCALIFLVITIHHLWK